MSQQQTTEDAATVIIGQRVRAGVEADFEKWQDELNRAASTYAGFVAAEVVKPTDVQPDWVVIYRFDSIANLDGWLNSATRQRYLRDGEAYLDGPATQQIVAGGQQPSDALVTVVVSHKIQDEDVDDFLAWQHRMLEAERGFEGFQGSELFRPVEGVQDSWTAMYRFDNALHLDAWLTSPERKQLLAEGDRFKEFELRKIDNTFGNWFAFDDEGRVAAPPSDIKSAIAVWMGLYPTVVLLTLALAPLKMPLWLGLLVGNLISSFIMSYLVMPYYVNPVAKNWLRPPAGARQPATDLRGLGLVLGINAVWVVVFYLMTTVFWTLP